jgi:hypothetical protein
MMDKCDTIHLCRPSADRLNAVLAAGGTVVVATYLRATQYRSRHAGMFFERGGALYVRRGRSADCLSIGDRLLVALRIAGG